MTDTAYHLQAWVITLAVGVPVFSFVARRRWRQAKTSLGWRFALCVLLALVFAPYVVSEDFGGYTTVDIVPVAMTLLAFLFISEHGAFLAGIAGIFYILLASLVPLFIWSAVLRFQKQRAHDAV